MTRKALYSKYKQKQNKTLEPVTAVELTDKYLFFLLT